ncbi:MAG TPA: glycosyl hydrolase [Chitinophagaceae bacterium]|nr:glycosyl hydrolase [Chitinophagaceae bacterium]
MIYLHKIVKFFYSVAATFFLLSTPYQPSEAQGLDHETLPTVSALAAHFKKPPPFYGPTVTWGWEGRMDTTVINRDLDTLRSLGFRMVTIEGGHMEKPYLSPGYFKLIRYAVQGAKKRHMQVWIIDEGKYPSGFAGGSFSKKRPDLRMQALVVDGKFSLAAGQTIDRKVSPTTLSAVACNADTSILLPVRDGRFQWTAPGGKGNWQLRLAGHAFRTSPTRSSNNPTGAKDQTNSLCDYLNPKATEQFIRFTHEEYKKYIGDAFGKTVLGFRSDEPAYSYTPWTPEMLQVFKEQKGYDIRPYLASFFISHPTEKQKLARADYWEVFSDLFRDHFFKVISDWCVKNHLEYEDHLDHDGPEDGATMLALGRSGGDYFRDMRYLQIPGIDVIWHQLWPGVANNFPKLASSAAHLFGRPQVFSESFAAFRPPPGIPQVKWVLNEQLVRGINLFEIMFYAASSGSRRGPHGFMASDSFPGVMRATGRKAYVLANGRPAASIGVYFPSASLWLKDTTANTATWRIARQLLEEQRDFDFVDYQSLASVMRLKNGCFINLSGQHYRTIILPPVKIIPKIILDRLKAFSAEGGKVIFMGRLPTYTRGKTFLGRRPLGRPSWAVRDTNDTLTAGLLKDLPAPDVRFDRACPSIKYLHRHLKDGEVYFFFNESGRSQTRTAALTGKGPAQVWRAADGTIALATGTFTAKGFVKIPLKLAPHETRIIVLGDLLKTGQKKVPLLKPKGG